jgi:hypothetical protein
MHKRHHHAAIAKTAKSTGASKTDDASKKADASSDASKGS